MRSDSGGVREAILAAKAAPEDPARRAEVARAWLRIGKADLALTWAREAYRLDRSQENAALLREVGRYIIEPKTVVGPPGDPPKPAAPPTQVMRIRAARASRVSESWESAPTQAIDPVTPASLESQLNALFGGDLFNEETQYGQLTAVRTLRPPRKGRRMFMSLMVGTFAVGLVAAGWVAHDLKKSRECATLVHDLEGFLRTGELRHADEALDRVRLLADDTHRTRELAPLMARAEATLYRYVDSSQDRKRSVEKLLKAVGEGTFDAVVARALITPPSQLGDLQPMLQKIATEARDPEAAFLVGVSLASGGRRKAADKAFEAAIDLEPANLPHLAHQARWLARTGHPKDADEVLDQMRTIDPESAWIDWVEEEVRTLRPMQAGLTPDRGGEVW